MEVLDLKKFVWMNRDTKEYFEVIGIVDYEDEDLVIYRRATGGRMHVKSVSDFGAQFEATY